MSIAPSREDIYDRAKKEGDERLAMPPLERVSTAFIAGVTIVFGIVALGVAESLAKVELGAQLAQLIGALAFGIGLVLLIVGRSELFSENFFGPVATALDRGNRGLLGLLRMWVVVLVLNLVGGAVLVGIMTVEGALPGNAGEVLTNIAEEIVAKSWQATLARAVLAGALLTLLSYLLHAVDTVLARILVAYMVGFLVALGPFDHVVVSALHVLFGVWLSDTVSYLELLANIGLTTAGNVLGGVLLMTLTHTAQIKGERSGK